MIPQIEHVLGLIHVAVINVCTCIVVVFEATLVVVSLILFFVVEVIVFLVVVSFVVVPAVAGSILFSFGDFSLINYSNYDISIILYLLFFVIRSIALSCIIAVILFIVINVFRKDISIVVFVILNSAFLIVPSSQEIINHFYDCCFLYHYYFLDIRYASFFLEFLCSVLFVLIMLIICNVFYKVLCKKKRELV